MEIWNYLGSQSAFSEVFAHFLAQSGSKSRAQVAAQGCQGIVRGSFLTSKPGRSLRGEKYFFSLKKSFPEKMTFYFAPGLRPTGAKPCINK